MKGCKGEISFIYVIFCFFWFLIKYEFFFFVFNIEFLGWGLKGRGEFLMLGDSVLGYGRIFF